MPFARLALPGEKELHLWYLHLGQLGGALQHALAGDTPATGEVKPGARQLRFARRFYLRLLLGAYLAYPVFWITRQVFATFSRRRGFVNFRERHRVHHASGRER